MEYCKSEEGLLLVFVRTSSFFSEVTILYNQSGNGNSSLEQWFGLHIFLEIDSELGYFL
jgi:hypothetical protein